MKYTLSSDVILDIANSTCCISCRYGYNVTGEQILAEINKELKKLEGTKHAK